MEIRNLKSFLKIAEVGNFTKAASDLNYSQSTVTTHIQQLEDELGVSLFDRIGNKNVLTEYGQQLVIYSKEILKTEEKIKNIGNLNSAKLQGSLRVGVVESIMLSLVLNLIPEYKKLLPEIATLWEIHISSTLFDMVKKNQVDLILTMGEMINNPEFVRAISHEESGAFFCSKDHPLAKEKDVHLKDVFEYPIILTGDETFFQQELNKLSIQAKKPILSTIKTDSPTVILNLVKENLGITFLNQSLVNYFKEDDGICVLPVSDLDFKFYVHVYYHKNKWVTPQMDHFIQLIDHYWQNEK